MSDNKSVIPESPAAVLRTVLRTCSAVTPIEDFELDIIVERILEAFEEHDIDVTWRPAEKAHGTLGDSVT